MRKPFAREAPHSAPCEAELICHRRRKCLVLSYISVLFLWLFCFIDFFGQVRCLLVCRTTKRSTKRSPNSAVWGSSCCVETVPGMLASGRPSTSINILQPQNKLGSHLRAEHDITHAANSHTRRKHVAVPPEVIREEWPELGITAASVRHGIRLIVSSSVQNVLDPFDSWSPCDEHNASACSLMHIDANHKAQKPHCSCRLDGVRSSISSNLKR